MTPLNVDYFKMNELHYLYATFNRLPSYPSLKVIHESGSLLQWLLLLYETWHMLIWWCSDTGILTDYIILYSITCNLDDIAVFILEQYLRMSWPLSCLMKILRAQQWILLKSSWPISKNEQCLWSYDSQRQLIVSTDLANTLVLSKNAHLIRAKN